MMSGANAVDIILPNLYLGDKNSAFDLELIGKLEVSHILSVDIGTRERTMRTGPVWFEKFHIYF